MPQFGQHSDLITTIRGIVKDYPEGTQIIKELLQNADDANARHVVLLLDKRTVASTTSVLGNREERDRPMYEQGNPYVNCKAEKGESNPMERWQGPALLVFDDATFLEKDFDSIQAVRQSQKKLDPSKTGQVQHVLLQVVSNHCV